MKLNIAAKTARQIKKLAKDIMSPWAEINNLILKLDGNHNRLMDKGIKVKSHELYEIFCNLAKEIENELIEQSILNNKNE